MCSSPSAVTRLAALSAALRRHAVGDSYLLLARPSAETYTALRVHPSERAKILPGPRRNQNYHGLRDDVRDDSSSDISQFSKSAGMQIGQAFVAQSEQIEDCGVHVPHVNGLFGSIYPELVAVA